MPRKARKPSNPGANRTDLLLPRGRPQGARQETEQAIQQGPPISGGGGFAAALAAATQAQPDPVGLGAPSQRPGEPITAGLGIGPGAGPNPLAFSGPDTVVLDELRAVYARYPNEGLRRIIERLESQS